MSSQPSLSLYNSILRCNNELNQSKIDLNFSGTTLITVLTYYNTLYCANVGDSRAVLGRISKKSNKVMKSIPLSRDHKADDEDEY